MDEPGVVRGEVRLEPWAMSCDPWMSGLKGHDIPAQGGRAANQYELPLG